MREGTGIDTTMGIKCREAMYDFLIPLRAGLFSLDKQSNLHLCYIYHVFGVVKTKFSSLLYINFSEG